MHEEPVLVAQAFAIQFPLLAMIASGFFFGRRLVMDESTLVTVIADWFMPLLIIQAIRTSRFEVRDLGDLVLAATIITAVMTVVALLFTRLTRSKASEVMMPIMFMNSGFLGIPLLFLWGGDAAQSTAIIFDQAVGIYMIAGGLVICTGRLSVSGVARLARSPLLLAVVAGFLLRLVPGDLPRILSSTLEFSAGVASPLAAFTVGVTIGHNRPEWSPRLAAGIATRFIMGAFSGWIAATVLGMTGRTAAAVILLAALPSAVFSYVLPARYGVDSSFARSMVALSTAFGLIVIPLIIMILG
ncbi:MAG: hypothetical protein EA427_17370 [Spirochaetaceae bacterium]|nr:MAG: hypothetical protein EA427_17370 [Spirochaetaceae bacterium]